MSAAWRAGMPFLWIVIGAVPASSQDRIKMSDYWPTPPADAALIRIYNNNTADKITWDRDTYYFLKEYETTGSRNWLSTWYLRIETKKGEVVELSDQVPNQDIGNNKRADINIVHDPNHPIRWGPPDWMRVGQEVGGNTRFRIFRIGDTKNSISEGWGWHTTRLVEGPHSLTLVETGLRFDDVILIRIEQYNPTGQGYHGHSNDYWLAKGVGIVRTRFRSNTRVADGPWQTTEGGFEVVVSTCLTRRSELLCPPRR